MWRGIARSGPRRRRRRRQRETRRRWVTSRPVYRASAGRRRRHRSAGEHRRRDRPRERTAPRRRRRTVRAPVPLRPAVAVAAVSPRRRRLPARRNPRRRNLRRRNPRRRCSRPSLFPRSGHRCCRTCGSAPGQRGRFAADFFVVAFVAEDFFFVPLALVAPVFLAAVFFVALAFFWRRSSSSPCSSWRLSTPSSPSSSAARPSRWRASSRPASVRSCSPCGRPFSPSRWRRRSPRRRAPRCARRGSPACPFSPSQPRNFTSSACRSVEHIYPHLPRPRQ